MLEAKLRSPAILMPMLAAAVACSNGAGSPQDASACDAATCQAIAQQIIEAGGGPGACTNPMGKLVAACQAYENCLKQCE